MIIVSVVITPISRVVPSGCDVSLSEKRQAAFKRQTSSADANAQLFVEHDIVTVEGFAADEAFAEALCAVARDVAGAEQVRDALIRVDAIAA